MSKSTENTDEKKIPWGKIISVGVTLIILFAGIVASWATNQADVSDLKEDKVKIEGRLKDVEDDVENVKLEAVKDSTVQKSIQRDVSDIKDDIGDIKDDIKELLKR
jgi:peptidoglycan hydrolase CwlO-like protein